MSYKNKKVLVTGGAGFIGSELVRQLSADGAYVVVLDNLSNGKKENLAEILTDKVELVVADIRDAEQVEANLEGVDVVFHLACLGVRHSIHSPAENHEVNASATLQLLELSRKRGVKRFVYTSSSEVYGTAKSVPMDEGHPTFPHTVYGASKLAGECYARAYFDTYSFPTCVVRPFNAYGPRCHHEGDSGEVIPKFMLRALSGKDLIIFGKGDQTRDFTFVGDTARGILLSGLNDDAVGQTINLGSGFELTVNDLARKIQMITGVTDLNISYDEPRPGDVMRLFANSEKAKQILDFAPRVSMEEGLKVLMDWYKGMGKSPEELLLEEKTHNWKQDSVSSDVG